MENVDNNKPVMSSRNPLDHLLMLRFMSAELKVFVWVSVKLQAISNHRKKTKRVLFSDYTDHHSTLTVSSLMSQYYRYRRAE